MISKEDKIRIAARLFFQDNENYETYEEAIKDMSEVSESFLDTVVSGIAKSVPGHRTLYRGEDGHVIRVRTKDDYLEPVTDMSFETGDNIQRCFQNEAEKNPSVKSAILLLQKCGWSLA